MIETTQTPSVRHLHDHPAIPTENPLHLTKGQASIFFTEMLQHAVGKHSVNSLIGKREITGISHEVIRVDSELARDTSSREHRI
jgi:hypothetical protein